MNSFQIDLLIFYRLIHSSNAVGKNKKHLSDKDYSALVSTVTSGFCFSELNYGGCWMLMAVVRVIQSSKVMHH